MSSGVWKPDSFFRITHQDKPLTRCGILSTTSSVYDPLGFLAPFILIGKQILQQLCHVKPDWDKPIPDQARVKWEKWRRELLDLEELKIRGCFIPNWFGEPSSIEPVLRQELDNKNVKEVFWTGSQVVVGYIRNDARCFHVFMANRVQQIRDSRDRSQKPLIG